MKSQLILFSVLATFTIGFGKSSGALPKSFLAEVSKFENDKLFRAKYDYIDSSRIDSLGRGSPKEIGYGFTQGGVDEAISHGLLPQGYRLPDKMTKADADAFLANIILPAFGKTVDKIVRVPLTENQRLALISFTFNLGSGNLRLLVCGPDRLNAGNYESVARILPKYCHAKNRILPGLERRRAYEANLWATIPAST